MVGVVKKNVDVQIEYFFIVRQAGYGAVQPVYIGVVVYAVSVRFALGNVQIGLDIYNCVRTEGFYGVQNLRIFCHDVII